MFEDEDVVVTKDMLSQVLETRIGGKAKQVDELEFAGDSHHLNSTDAIGLGRDIWSKVDVETHNARQSIFNFDEAKVKESLQAAKSSRRVGNLTVVTNSEEIAKQVSFIGR